MATRRAIITVSGLVQGVSFRAYTHRTASQLDLTGYVRNMPDGRVEIMAEGEPGALERLIAWARTGPPAAEVEEVKAVYEEATGEFNSFHIRH